MREEIKSDIKFILKCLVYSTIFILIFQVISGIYIKLVEKGMVAVYLLSKNLPRLDRRLQVYLKLQPAAIFFGLLFATPNIDSKRRMKFAVIGFVGFYFFDVIFAASQVLDLTTLLSAEQFIRYISVIVFWSIFSYNDYLKEKFVI